MKTEMSVDDGIKLLVDCGFLKPDNKDNPLSSRYFIIPSVYRTALGIKSSGIKKSVI